MVESSGGTAQAEETAKLLRLMQGLFVPMIAQNTTWPEYLRKELTGQLHKFMASLTESVYSARGQTVLYVPAEKLPNAKAAAGDASLVRRLEVVVIHWTRQVREVAVHASSDLAEQAGPLEEIAYWQARAVDLGGICSQLDSPQVKRMVAVLERAGSPYLLQFQSLESLLQAETAVAEDNLRHLGCLQQPCQALAEAGPHGIAPLLGPILMRMRLLWSVSTFYGTPERLQGLLRTLSNEVISRCRAAIHLKDVIEGRLETVVVALQQSIEACQQWEAAYAEFAAALAQHCKAAWSFDTAPVFAHVQAFTLRCRDLLDMCQAQQQFGGSQVLPQFGGPTGAETGKAIQGVQAAFAGLLARLQSLDYDLLDVRALRWYDDFAAFRRGLAELEAGFCVAVDSAIERAASLAEQTELLMTFLAVAKREPLVRHLSRKTSALWQALGAEVEAVKEQVEALRGAAPRHPGVPHCAGRALAARNLLRRLEGASRPLQEALHMLPAVPEATAVTPQAEALRSALQQLVSGAHREWLAGLDLGCGARLGDALLAQERRGGTLTCNCDAGLLDMLHEAHHWERLRMTVPAAALELGGHRERLRLLLISCTAIVHQYNQVVGALDREERRLFHNCVRALDRRVLPAATKLSWAAPTPLLDAYFKEAGRQCREALAVVAAFKAGARHVEEVCTTIRAVPLFNLDRRRLCDLPEFVQLQAQQAQQAEAAFMKAHEDIQQRLQAVHTCFANDSDEVHREWAKYLLKVDKRVEGALRQAVRHALELLVKALVGDRRSAVAPLLRTEAFRDRTGRLEVRPDLQELGAALQAVALAAAAAAGAVPCLAQQGGALRVSMAPPPLQADAATSGAPQPPEAGSDDAPEAAAEQAPRTFHDAIMADEAGVGQYMAAAGAAVGGTMERLQELLSSWEAKYRQLWEQDKDAFIRRYEKAQKPVSAFEEDIGRYRILGEAVAEEEDSDAIKFLFVDLQPLKQVLAGHCELWCERLGGLLQTLAARELRTLQDLIAAHTATLQATPRLETVAAAAALQRHLGGEEGRLEGRLAALQEKYAALQALQIETPVEELDQLQALPPAISSFQALVQDAGASLQGCRASLRATALQDMSALQAEVDSVSAEVIARAPLDSQGLTPEEALDNIKSGKAALTALHAKLEGGIQGMNLLGLPAPDLSGKWQSSIQELEVLERVWLRVRQWQQLQHSWNLEAKPTAIEVRDMGEAVQEQVAAAEALAAGAPAHWPVIVHLQESQAAVATALQMSEGGRCGEAHDRLRKLTGQMGTADGIEML